MVRGYLAYKEQAKQLQGVVDLAYRELKLAQDAALAGKSLHTGTSMLVWDELQLDPRYWRYTRVEEGDL